MKQVIKKIYYLLWGAALGLKLDSLFFNVKPLRSPVVFVIPYMGVGGIENTVLGIAAELRRRGCPVVFISTIDAKLTRKGRFTSLSPAVFTLGTLRLSEELKSRLIAGLIRRMSPSKVILAHPWESGYLALKRLSDNGTPAAAMEIILGAGDELESAMRTGVLEKAKDLISSTVAVSRSTADFAATHYGLDRNKITVIHNGTAISPAPSKDRPRGTKILWAGRFGREKRLDVAVLALHKLLTAYPETVLTIAGSGPEEAAVRRLARELGLEKNLTFLGDVTDMARLYDSHDALWVTSLSEGIPLVLLEAMERELVVISTDCGGVGEALRPGQNGILVPLSPDSREQARLLADATAEYFSLPAQKKQELSSEARKTVIKEFDSKKQLDDYVSLIEA